MKRLGGMLVGVGAVFLLAVAPAQAAMRVIVARMLGGQVEVVGFRAAKKAPITWQGTEVATSTAGGTFFFHNGAVPPSCVGKLSDGVETAYIPVQGCVPTGVNLAATGQKTESYAEGDDGDIQAGVPLPSPRFTVNDDGTVTDHLTGLMWLQDANCAQATGTWTDALDWVAELNIPTSPKMNGQSCENYTATYTDWRLPNRKELESLLDLEFANPALSNVAGTDKWSDGDAFFNVKTDYPYWSSTSIFLLPPPAWTVSFAFGEVKAFNKEFNSYYVLPVRGGL